MRVFLSMLLMLFSIAAAAATNADPEIVEALPEQVNYTLQTIVVTATRTPHALWMSDANVAILTAEQIEQSSARNLGEALKYIPGVSIGEYGSTGQNISLGIRGSTAGQVLIMMDGVPINDPQMGGLDLNSISLDNVERVEIVRGAASALYGADAVGGVINVITKSSNYDIPFSVVGYQQGEFGYHRISGRFARRIGSRISFNIVGSSANSDGFRDNSDYEGRHLGGRLSWHIENGGEISYSSQMYDAQLGIPGMENFPTPNAQQDDGSWHQALSLELFPAQHQQLSAILYRNYSQQEYIDPDWFTEAQHRRWVNGLELQYSFPLASKHQLTLGGDFQNKRLDSSENGRQDLNQGAFFAQDELTLQRSAHLRIAGRYDFHEKFENQFSPDLTLTWLAGKCSSVFISLRRSYRAPTFNDLYWPQSEYDYDFDGQLDYAEAGNDRIKPEKAVAFQLGGRAQRGALSANACLFRREMRDLIQWDNIDSSYSCGRWMPVNKSEATFQGLELDAAVQLTDGFQISLSYTYLRAMDDLLDKRLPYQPGHQLAARLQNGLVLIADQLDITGSLGLQYLGERFADAWEGEELPSTLLIDGTITARVMRAFQIYLVSKNLSDEHYFLRSGYPLPGRAYYGGLTWEFWD